jgi:serine/threonine-protein kinase HipA
MKLLDADILKIIYGKETVAELRRDKSGMSLQYMPGMIKNAADLPVISVSLPVRKEPYQETELLSFFEGILPEGSTRERLSKRLHLDPKDLWGFLREIGRDCAGALVILPQELDYDTTESSKVEWLDEKELAIRIDELKTKPLAIELEKDIRLSLAGVQNKMVVVVGKDGRIGLPIGTTPSTHILKPESRELKRNGKLAFPDLVSNELFCMKLASVAGLNVPEVNFIQIENEPAFLIARYDRILENGEVKRVHQEDLCQALGIKTDDKYQKDGGPSLKELIDVIKRYSGKVMEDIDAVIDQVGFNYLIGNADAHGKNFSLLHTKEGIRLAPAYDLVSTRAYDQLSKNMAMSIGGLYDDGTVRKVHWVKEFANLEISEKRYLERLSNLSERVLEAMPSARKFMIANNADNSKLTQVEFLIGKRAKLLKAEPHIEM